MRELSFIHCLCLHSAMCVSVFVLLAIIVQGTVLGQLTTCPVGWTGYGSSCYFLHTHDEYDWIESMGWCESHNAHLAYIEDQAENTFIKDMIQKTFTSNGGHVWLGATDEIQDDVFVWYGVEKPVTFTDWGPTEPNATPEDLTEDCLIMWSDYSYQWADYDCHDEAFFICEKSSSDSVTVIG